jgi:hypothetical protein
MILLSQELSSPISKPGCTDRETPLLSGREGETTCSDFQRDGTAVVEGSCRYGDRQIKRRASGARN